MVPNERNKKSFSRPVHYTRQILRIDKNDIELNFSQKENKYIFWPDPPRQSWILKDEVHLQLASPTIDRRLHLLFEEDDIDEMILINITIVFYILGVHCLLLL